jgi:PKD repeat protein
MNFVNTSSIGVGTMTYNWSFAGQGTSTLTNPTHTFTGFNSAFSVTLTATSNNGCVKTLVKPVTVWANPIAASQLIQLVSVM